MIIEEAKNVKPGDVLYFVDSGYQGRLYVNFGVADSDLLPNEEIYINLLALAEHRYISSEYIPPTPIDDFKTETEWHKLPKGWTYNTELFKIEDKTPEEEIKRREMFKINNPDDIRQGLEEGLLVLASTIYHGEINSEIDHDRWRIKKAYPAWRMHYGDPNPNYRVVRYPDIFWTWDECKSRITEIMAERKRIADMSDDEWSIMEMEKDLKFLHNPEYAAKCRTFLLGLPDIADVETRRREGKIEWRYFRKTEWTMVPVQA